MERAFERQICLKSPDGETIEIGESLSIGRTPNNGLAVDDERVSRRHAVIHSEENGKHWIADYGSRNGTFVNARRITQPTALSHGDLISIGSVVYTFFDLEPADDEPGSSVFSKTRDHIRGINCWMLLADITNSTGLLQTMPQRESRAMTRAWIDECRALITEHGGSINTLLGDGFFAYWQEPPDSALKLNGFLDAFRELQDRADPEFRCLLHHGPALHGGASGLEGCLSGIEVHFAFRIEKLAGELEKPRLMSESAMRLLAMKRKTTKFGEHELKGFDGKYPMFEF